MSYQSWPSTLPGHLEQIDQQIEVAMRRTVMESTRVRQRRRFSKDLLTHNVRFYFTDAQWATFQTFFSQAINNGQDWFIMQMRVGGFGGVQSYVCRFICGGSQGPYNIKFQEPLWLLTAQIELAYILIPDQGDIEMATIINLTVTARTGGGPTNLDGVPTIGRAVPSLLMVVFASEGFLVWELITSSAATSSECVQPLDNSALRWMQRN